MKKNKIKPDLIGMATNNPHLTISFCLFLLGSIFLSTKNLTAVAGALFGASASLLGAWISEYNSRKKDASSQQKRQEEAIKSLSPELVRTIKRVIHIHERALVNYSTHHQFYIQTELLKRPKNDPGNNMVFPDDKKDDFIPYLPVLYPNTSKLNDLNENQAVALISFYDSLLDLDFFVKDWWKREGQIEANIYNVILHMTRKSLELSLDCIEEFKLESVSINNHENILKKINDSFEKQNLTYKRFDIDYHHAQSLRK